MNTEDSIIDPARIELAIQQRFSPFPSMTMELLTAQLNAFRIGELRPAARSWEIMMERDGDLSAPATQRFSDAARLPWIIEKDDDSDEAQADHDALMFFYKNLTATSVLEQNETGGVSLLFRQMMTAKAFRYSTHEMLLRISSAGRREVTAEFNHCPVWFFECRRGKLGFLQKDFDAYGLPCERGDWLTAIERFPAMPACSVAYITKWRPLADWLLFSYRFGVPGIHGETSAVMGSPEWIAFVAALRAFANDWVTATSGAPGSNKINLIEAAKGGAGTLPFQELIERSDRLYARIFRGGDLGTQSRAGSGVVGSDAQSGESAIKLADDAQWLTDNCNAGIDEPVIGYLFNRRPRAWLRVQVPKKIETDREVKAMEFLRDSGGRIAVKAAHERLQIPMADPAETELLTKPAAPAQFGVPPPGGPIGLGNDATSVVRQAIVRDFTPLFERLKVIGSIEDADVKAAKRRELLADWDRLTRSLTADPTTARALSHFSGLAALVNSAGQPRDSLGKWVDANGGGLSVKDNIARGRNARDRAIRQRADVPNAMYRKEVGPIDFPYGQPGTPHPDASGATHADGYGIAKMLVKHPKELNDLPVTLAKGRIIPHDREPEKKRYVIHGNNLAVLGITPSKSWAVTHFGDPSTIHRLEKESRPAWLTGK